MSEFGKGLRYNLGLFIAHENQLKQIKIDNEKLSEKPDIFFTIKRLQGWN